MNHCTEFSELHVMAKNVQSIRSDNKFQDFIAELENCDFDIVLVSKTWRDKREEVIVTEAGHKVFLSGGSCRNGVGICVSRRLLDQKFLDLHSSQFLTGYVVYISRSVTTISKHWYMPTSWEPDDAAEHVYDLLGMLLVNCDQAGAIPIIGADFNAVIRNPLPGDDDDLLGTCGFGPRNDRGWMFVRWVLEHGLLIQVVWIEIFDMTTVGLATVPWMECGSRWIIF